MRLASGERWRAGQRFQFDPHLPGHQTGPCLQWESGWRWISIREVIHVGTAVKLRFFKGTMGARLIVCVSNCTNLNLLQGRVSGNWFGDTRSFTMPYESFPWWIPGAMIGASRRSGGCGHWCRHHTRYLRDHGGKLMGSGWTGM